MPPARCRGHRHVQRANAATGEAIEAVGRAHLSVTLGCAPGWTSGIPAWHGPCAELGAKEVHAMLWTIVLVLLILWLLGVVALPAVGGLIHLLLVLALIVLVVQLLTGRRVAL
jgi:hypothetical protein